MGTIRTQLYDAELTSADPEAPEVELTFGIVASTEDQRLIGKQIKVAISADDIELPEGTEWVNGSGLKMKGD